MWCVTAEIQCNSAARIRLKKPAFVLGRLLGRAEWIAMNCSSGDSASFLLLIVINVSAQKQAVTDSKATSTVTATNNPIVDLVATARHIAEYMMVKNR